MNGSLVLLMRLNSVKHQIIIYVINKIRAIFCSASSIKPPSSSSLLSSSPNFRLVWHAFLFHLLLRVVVVQQAQRGQH